MCVRSRIGLSGRGLWHKVVGIWEETCGSVVGRVVKSIRKCCGGEW